jgi:hypothetical protein
VLGHTGAPAADVFAATGLFLLAIGAAFGAFWLFTHPSNVLRRTLSISLGVVAVTRFGVATAFPLLVGASPSLSRPSTTAQLEIVAPRSGEVIHGDPASVPVQLHLVGGTVVPTTSLRLVPNEGHIHLYLDGSLVSMTTGLGAIVTVAPGQHELRAEFVAVDHLPFQPRLLATITFTVRP